MRQSVARYTLNRGRDLQVIHESTEPDHEKQRGQHKLWVHALVKHTFLLVAMSPDPADKANPSSGPDPTAPLPAVRPADARESTETARGTKAHGRPIITSPHTIVESAQVNAEGQFGVMRPTTTSWKEPNVTPKAYPERTAYVDSSISEDGSHSSTYADLYIHPQPETTTSDELHQPTIRTPVAKPSKPAGLPSIRVQQPTRSPSEEAEDMVPQRHLEPQAAEFFVKSPLRRISVSRDITTAAPDITRVVPETLTAVTELPITEPFQPPTGVPQLFTASRSRRLLRRVRNRVIVEPLLQLVLGRSVAQVAKPALHLAAHPTTEPLLLPQVPGPVAP